MSIAHSKPAADALAAGAEGLIAAAATVVGAADKVLAAAKSGVQAKVQAAGGIDAAQHVTHGLAWLATTVEGLRQMQHWADAPFRARAGSASSSS